MTIITYSEITEYLKDCYTDTGEQIICKHGVFTGEKDFALCLIEQILGLLNRADKNDKFIIQYLQGLLTLSQKDNTHYSDYLNVFAPNEEIKRIAIQGSRLTTQDRRVLEETMHSNLGEYITKGDYQSCCYTAMKAFLIAAYCILIKEIQFQIGGIDIIADLDDDVQSINISESKDDSIIIIQWHSTNKINSIYMLYKTKFSGLDDATILDLVAADVIEEDYYLKDERFSIAPSILMKQYCAIIEHEVNEIIQLLNLPDKPSRHLMWNKMKQYIADNNIDLDGASFELVDALEDLHGLRNKADHGDVITKEEYAIMQKYKQDGLFDLLSVKKLSIRGIVVHPTINEIQEYMA